MVYIKLKTIKSLKNEIDSFTRKTAGKTNRSGLSLNPLKNESASKTELFFTLWQLKARF